MSKSQKIIQLLETGKTPQEIAKRLGVNPQYVYTVRSNKKKSRITQAVQETKLNLNIVNNNVVDRPAHYTEGGIEVIDYIEAKDFNYRLGNVIKYVSRAGRKIDSDPIEDLKKARWYLDREINARERA